MDEERGQVNDDEDNEPKVHDDGLPPLDYTVKDMPRVLAGMNSRDSYAQAVKRRKEMVNALMHGMTIEEALEHTGITNSTLKWWRARDKDFRARMDRVLFERDDREDPGKLKADYSFMEFRKIFFHRDTPEYQHLIIDAYEHTPLGNITLILIPPEHGKTTIFEDYACFKLAYDPNFRFLIANSTQKLGEKMIGRIRNRMEPDGPYPKYVKNWGPFVPQFGAGRKTRQVWSDTQFNVNRRKAFDERDYSMAAIGIKGEITGARCDHLHGDDLQSVRTLSLTQRLLEVFRQDWLTRPGESGRTTINGTRVGDGDIYEELEKQFEGDDIFKLIKMPAIVFDDDNQSMRPLWPREGKYGYTMTMLERMQKKVGPDAWARNYMQAPRAKGSGVFTEEMFDKCVNTLRRIGETAVPGAPYYIGLDPAIGGRNCIVAFQVTAERMYLTDVVEDTRLARNEEIMARLEMVLRSIESRGGRTVEVIVETKNFQAGLGRDERFEELATRFNFHKREHLTGINKYDEDIGISSMALSYNRQAFDIPGGDDAKTQEILRQYREQHMRWRPFLKGADLRQDMVMAEWFAWIQWNSHRRTVEADSSQFRSMGIPWRQTKGGLITPASAASPFYRKG